MEGVSFSNEIDVKAASTRGAGGRVRAWASEHSGARDHAEDTCSDHNGCRHREEGAPVSAVWLSLSLALHS